MRQGCPLSPLLYVLSIVVLAVSLCTSPAIQELPLPNSMEEFRSSGYADTTVAATSDVSIEETFAMYQPHERASGAWLNRRKSKGMWAGFWKDCTDTLYRITWVKDLLLLSGTFNVGDYSRPTWEQAVTNHEQRLAAWSGRRLSFQGKTVVINTLGHLFHVFPVQWWAEKQINKAVWSFFWSGHKDLVARATVCLPKSQRGFGVINFTMKTQAFALQWLKHWITWIKDLPLLSGTFNVGDYSRLTWEPAITNLEQCLAAWSGGTLSFQSKIVVINTLGHLFHVFPVPWWAEK